MIVDANRFDRFFSENDFEVARRWIHEGPGRLVIGGTKYHAELAARPPILNLVLQLDKARRVTKANDEAVDRKTNELIGAGKIKSNDQHIVALVIVSGCQIVCTDDKKLRGDIRSGFRKKFGLRRPRLYDGSRHNNLICDANIVAACRK